MEECCRPEAGSNHCEKVKEMLSEKLEHEGRDAFLHEHLKTIQENFNDYSKIMLILCRKEDFLKSM